MLVSEAVAQRKSIRAFLDKPVGNELIADLLAKAARSPSGGNVQPWQIYVVNGDSMNKFKTIVANQTEGCLLYTSPSPRDS